MSLTRKVAFNTIFQVIGRVLGILITILTTGILTRYLGVDDYGKYNLIFVYVSFFIIFADLGLFTTTVREISKEENNISEIISTVFILRILLSVPVILTAIGLSFVFYPGAGREVLRSGIMIGSLLILLNLGISGFTAVFQSKLKMGLAAIAEFVGKASVFLFILVASYLKVGLNVIVFLTLVGSFITFLLSAFYSRKFLKLKWTFNKKIAWEYSLKSIPLGIVLILSIIHFKVDTIILSLMKSDYDVGIYGLSYRFLEAILAFGTFFMASIFPIFSRYVAKEQEKLPNAIQKSFDAILIVGVPLIFGGLVLGNKLINLVGGANFSQASLPLKILVVAALFSFLNSLFANMIIAKDEQKRILWISFVGVPLNIILNLIFIPRFSYIGASWVTVFSEFLGMFLLGIIAFKIYNFFPSFKNLFKIVFSSIIMYLVLSFLLNLNTLLLLLIGVFVYFIVLFLIKGLDKNILLQIIKGEEKNV